MINLEPTQPTLYNIDDKQGYKGYRLNLNDKKHNKYTLSNIFKGMEGERMIQYFLRTKWGLPVEGNDLNYNYNNQHGIDISHKESGFYAGVKNNSGKYYLDMDWVRDQKVLEDFPENAKFKVLFIAHNKLLPEAREILDCANIKVIEWGEQLLGQSWNRALGRLYNSMWDIYYKLNSFFNQSNNTVSQYYDKLHSIGNINEEIESKQHTLIEYIQRHKDIKLDIIDKNIEKKPPPRLGGWFGVPDLQRELWRFGG